MGPGHQQLHSINYVDITSYQHFSKSLKCLSLFCFFWAALLIYWAVVFSREAAIKMYEVMKIMESKEECLVETYKHVVRRLP